MGLYDTVTFECPKCQALIHRQSKAGACKLHEHGQSHVPSAIAASLLGDDIPCYACGGVFVVDTVLPPIHYVAMKLKEKDSE